MLDEDLSDVYCAFYSENNYLFFSQKTSFLVFFYWGTEQTWIAFCKKVSSYVCLTSVNIGNSPLKETQAHTLSLFILSIWVLYLYCTWVLWVLYLSGPFGSIPTSTYSCSAVIASIVWQWFKKKKVYKCKVYYPLIQYQEYLDRIVAIKEGFIIKVYNIYWDFFIHTDSFYNNLSHFFLPF